MVSFDDVSTSETGASEREREIGRPLRQCLSNRLATICRKTSTASDQQQSNASSCCWYCSCRSAAITTKRCLVVVIDRTRNRVSCTGVSGGRVNSGSGLLFVKQSDFVANASGQSNANVLIDAALCLVKAMRICELFDEGSRSATMRCDKSSRITVAISQRPLV